MLNKHRQVVTKLRISAHRLPVETGPYSNVLYDKNVGNKQLYFNVAIIQGLLISEQAKYCFDVLTVFRSIVTSVILIL